jgi:hypothetical protein
MLILATLQRIEKEKLLFVRAIVVLLLHIGYTTDNSFAKHFTLDESSKAEWFHLLTLWQIGYRPVNSAHIESARDALCDTPIPCQKQNQIHEPTGRSPQR